MKSNPNNILVVFAFLFLTTLVGNAQPLSGTKTIGTGGTYATLTSAISAVSGNGINGPLVLELQANYNSSSETFPLTFSSIAGTSNINTITIRPAAGATALSIAGNNPSTVINFSGVQYVIIDGRPGGSGNFIKGIDLIIANTNGNAPSVLYTNDTRYTTIKFCDLEANNITPITTTNGGGIVCFGSTVGSNGNDDNTISNCDFHSYPGGNPAMCLFGYGSTGSSAQANDNNIIDNCNFYDFTASIATAAINIGTGCSGWTITNNRFYQTTSLVHSTAVTHRVIFISAGSGYTITDNFIGGNHVSGSGLYAINTAGASAANVLFVIDYTSTAIATTTLIKNNTITNLDYTSASTGSAGAVLLQIYGGNVDCINNTIGSATTNGSIRFTAANAAAGGVTGLIALRVGTSANVVNVTGNTISGIDLFGAGPSYAPEFHGINLTTGTATSIFTATNNTVGSPTLANSINIVSSCSTSTAGSRLNAFIINNTTGMIGITVANNIVANMNTNYSATGTQAASLRGIWFNPQATGNYYINNNQVYNLTTASQTTGSGVNSALIGISVNTTTGAVSMSGNHVRSLILTGTSTSAAVQAEGIFYSGISTTTNTIERNFIHNIGVNAANPFALVTGMEISAGQVTAQNNMFSLGYDTAGNSITTPLTFRGIVKLTANLNLYHNTVFIGGTGVGNSSNITYALQRITAATDDFRNNIFINNRSNATSGASHYQIYLGINNSLTMNYNHYFGNGNGTVFGFNGNNDVVSYTSGWLSGDVASFSASNPNLVLPNGNTRNCNLHLSAVANKGLSISGITNDLDGDVRNSPSDIGADEIPYDIGVLAIDSPSTLSFCSQSKNIYVRIKNYGTIPLTSAIVRLNVNGGLYTSYNWSGNLLSGTTSASFNIGSLLFNGGITNISVNTNSPNGKIDNNASNDSASLTYTIIPIPIPAITVSTVSSTVCINTPVAFKAVFANGGLAPVFVWKKNGLVVGSNDSSYNSSTLANNDSITVTLTSNAACASPTTATSNQIKMTVGVTLPPSITIQASNTAVCPGTAINFTATPTNGGTTPHYTWLKNGIVVGTDSTKFNLTAPTNNDAIKCVLTSSLSCASKPQDTSLATVITVTPAPIPTAIVSVTSTTICSGQTDTFSVAITNGGSTPIYSWRKNNGIGIGLNSPTLITNNLSNGDSIYLVLTSNAACANPTIVTSNKIGITINNTVSPTLSINANKSSICNGESVTFKSTYTNAGSAPIKQWYKNNTALLSGVDSITVSNLNNTDTIYMMLTSNATCVVNPSVSSNKLTTIVNALYIPIVSATASSSSICSGSPVSYYASYSNSGFTPHFIWRKNGLVVGSDSGIFTSNTITSKDTVSLVLISTAPCSTKASDTSNAVIINVTPTVTPAISISTTTPAFCTGASVSFTSTPLNTGTTPHIQWYKNSTTIGTDSSGLTYSSFVDRDTVYAVLTSSATCVSTNNVKSNKVILLAYPSVNASVNITESVNSICSGTNVTFTAYPANGGLTPVYSWKLNGNTVGTNAATFASNTLSNNDSVMVFMTSSSNCAVPAIAPSNKIGMTVKPSVTPKLSITNSENSVCNGSVVTFTANDSFPGTLPTHRWFKNNVSVGSDSVKYTTAIAPTDIIKCILTSNASCATKTKDTSFVTITVKPLPAKPTISRSRDSLTSSIAPSYQWYFNNNSMSGATNQLLVITQNGTYKVMVDSLGCSNTSNTLTVANLAVKEAVDFGNLSLAPNPTQQIILVNAEFNTSAPTQITIMDITGRELMTTDLGNTKTITNHSLDLGKYDDGSYLVFVKHGEDALIKKIIRSK